ncbi:hypothetical protein SPRG_13812 [Saprolegnia parasitica CBS 223.65]|uniref:Uncharacterized protein n=1 Tax=Saprolegnia parasitica (strain CBS 223.65) TaxID=695850 RepID=A0A067C3H9_SAPPC|nr:hypothetical protein SPRG_13812 [Saprolegnia parasitica CBS 223.65]KDO21106.1 hypothetical protein SPRG_13812 [Saprolegnia parasitica CBS 223.65]|eukprot:XP_012208198.1 hypothetical protein SPRG_13812 [Saprolegnia parasitica CBS 223.65]
MTAAEYIVVSVIAIVLLLLIGICVRQRRAGATTKDRALAASLVSSSPLFCGHSRRSLMDLGLPAPSLSLSTVGGLRGEASSQNDTALSSSDATEYAPPVDTKATPMDPALRTFNDDFFVLSQRGGQNGLPLLESTRGDAPPRHISVVESIDEHHDDNDDENDRPSALWHSFLEEGRSLSVFSGGFSDMDDDDDDLNNSFLQPQRYTESIADDEDDDDELNLHGVLVDAASVVSTTKVDL